MKNFTAQQKIKDAVKKLVAAEETSLTVGTVMAAAGLPRTSFYASYDNLEHVFIELENELIDTYYAISCETMQDPVTGSEKLAAYLCENRLLLRYLCAPERGNFFPEKFSRIAEKLAQSMVRLYGTQGSAFRFDLINVIFQGSLQCIVKYAMEDRPEKIREIIFSGLRLLQAVSSTEAITIPEKPDGGKGGKR